MSRKNVVLYPVSLSTSLSADFTTAPTIIRYLDNCSYQINVLTSDSTGTFYVQSSDDYAVDETTNTVLNAGNWADLPLGGGTPSAGAANDTILIYLNQLPFNAIRVRYAHTVAGTGTASIYLMAKQLG